MVVIRISPGFANSLMEFCGGYALARELSEDIMLDIGLCQDSAWGYLVDMFNIPDYKKYTYYTSDCHNQGLRDPKSIPDKLRSDAECVNIPDYPNLNSASWFKGLETDLFLCDFFMDRFKYFDKYWDELLPMMTYRGRSDNIDSFKKLIKDRISVGVHIRRTDMLYSGYTLTEDDYYKAAIEYCRKNIASDALFCVFSDDIKYARMLLGDDENIKYVHFVGYDDVDVEEFACLSLCDHRIRSRSSSYGDFADSINGAKNRITLIQGDLEKRSVFDKLKSRFENTGLYYSIKKTTGKIKKRSLDELDEKFERLKFEKKNYNFRIIDRSLINKYAPLFVVNKNDQSTNLLESILSTEVTKNNAVSVLDRMREYELNYAAPSPDDDIIYRYKKFRCYYLTCDYERAVGLADYIWGCMKKSDNFRTEYAATLKKLGIEGESRLVSYNGIKCSFIIISDAPATYSSSVYGMGELAVGLAKMGFDVSVVYEPQDETEAIYMDDHTNMTNRHEVVLGSKWYKYRDVEKEGFFGFIKRVSNEEITNKRTIVISRVPGVFCDKVPGVCYIWIDDADENDPEKSYYTKYSDKRTDMINSADYILTCQANGFSGEIENKLILYNSVSYQTQFWVTEERMKQHHCHRLSKRILSICNSLGAALVISIFEGRTYEVL